MRRKRGSESEAFCLMTYLPRGELLKLLNLRWRRKWILSCCCFCSRSPTILKTIETAAMDRGIHGRTVSFEWNFSFECFQGPGIKWNVVRSIPSSTLYDKSVTSAMPVLQYSYRWLFRLALERGLVYYHCRAFTANVDPAAISPS